MTTNKNKGNSGKKSKFGTALTFAALFIVGGLVGLGIDSILGFLGIDFGEANVNPWVLIPSLLSLIFVLAFHETGHVLAGKLVGFRFTLFIVGPFKVHSTESGIHFGLNRSLMLAGGLGGAAPTDSRNLPSRTMAYVAGGPAASLLLAISALGLLYVVPTSIGIVLSIIAMSSFFIGIVTLIPTRMGGLVSDGARLLMLRRSGPEAERWCAIAAVGGASMAGKRPRDWDEEMIRRSLLSPDGSLDAAGEQHSLLPHPRHRQHRRSGSPARACTLSGGRPGDGSLPGAP